jgi:UDP-N-acetylglucosamine:LPS N-acetylglucosamine transferase
MGEGHNSTGRALAEAARESWPGCRVHWLDTLEVMGPGVGPVLRWIYVTNVRSTPWLYESFYAGLRHHRWFAQASKRFVGAWAGRRLRGRLRTLRPDLILSTYPLGSAGLAWLRRRGQLPQPAAAWVSDFAPHPFWVYPELDRTYVMHELAVEVGRSAEPQAQLAVSELPVTRRFRTRPGPGTRGAVRSRLGVGPDAPLVLISSGAFGFGDLCTAVAELLQADHELSLVVVCGRNESLRHRLSGLVRGPGRLCVLGWVEDMPALLAACDVVVSNAGGATALEALASGRPVLMFRPIAAHGRANAELMARAGLTSVCSTAGELATAVRRVLAPVTIGDADVDPEDPVPVEDHLSGPRALRTVAPGSGPGLGPGDAVAKPAPDLPAELRLPAEPSLVDELRLLDELRASDERRPRDSRRRLAAADALFLNVETPQVPQQIGAVIVLRDGGKAPLPLAAVAALARAVPGVAGRLHRGGRWHRPAWVPSEEGAADPEREVDLVTRVVDGGGRPSAVPVDGRGRLITAVDGFFSRPLDLRGPPARLRLLAGLPEDEEVLLVQVHHALCDGVALTRALVAAAKRFSPSDDGRAPAVGRVDQVAPVEQGAAGVGEGVPEHRVSGRGPRTPDRTPGGRSPGFRSTVRAVASLARSGRAPTTVLAGEIPGPVRRHVLVDLPTAQVRAAARLHGVSVTELLVGLFAESLRTAVPGLDATSASVRMMVPRTMSRRDQADDPGPGAGNRTGAVPLDVPVGPMPLHERLVSVSSDLHRRIVAGQPAAAQAVVRLTGALPPPLARWVHRRIYGARWFSAIATVLPGIPRGVDLDGREVARVYPVLPLAPGVNVAFGAIPGGQVVGICVTLGPALAGHGPALAEALPRALADALAAGAEASTSCGHTPSTRPGPKDGAPRPARTRTWASFAGARRRVS